VPAFGRPDSFRDFPTASRRIEPRSDSRAPRCNRCRRRSGPLGRLSTGTAQEPMRLRPGASDHPGRPAVVRMGSHRAAVRQLAGMRGPTRPPASSFLRNLASLGDSAPATRLASRPRPCTNAHAHAPRHRHRPCPRHPRFDRRDGLGGQVQPAALQGADSGEVWSAQREGPDPLPGWSSGHVQSGRLQLHGWPAQLFGRSVPRSSLWGELHRRLDRHGELRLLWRRLRLRADLRRRALRVYAAARGMRGSVRRRRDELRPLRYVRERLCADRELRRRGLRMSIDVREMRRTMRRSQDRRAELWGMRASLRVRRRMRGRCLQLSRARKRVRSVLRESLHRHQQLRHVREHLLQSRSVRRRKLRVPVGRSGV